MLSLYWEEPVWGWGVDPVDSRIGALPCPQILNLTQALKDGKSPLHLVQMPPVIVETARSHQRSASEAYTQSFQSRKPFFSWW